MALFRRRQPTYAASPGSIPGLTASGQVMDQALPQTSPARRWQAGESVWQFYRSIGELHSSTRYIANGLRRVRLVPAFLGDDDEPGPLWDEDGALMTDEDGKPLPGLEEATANAARTLLRGLRSRTGGQSQMMARLGALMALPADAYLLGTDDLSEDGRVIGRSFEALSPSELRPKQSPSRDGSTWERRRSPGVMPEDVPAGSLVLRIWRDDPQYSGLADSSVAAMADVLEENVMLTREVMAEARSRLLRGWLLIPDSVQVPTAADIPPGVDPVSWMFMRAASQAITDKSSAASMIPLVSRMKADDIKETKLIEFHGPDSAASILKRKETIERIAHGQDLPPEKVTGMAGTTFCADEETEILTRDGWRRCDELAVGTPVLTLNHATGLSEWQPALAVNVFDVVDEPMLLAEGQAHSSFTTAMHRWPVVLTTGHRTWRTTEELRKPHRVITAAPCAELPTEGKYSDDFVELVAWHWTEGHVTRPKKTTSFGVTVISQSLSANPAYCARIRGLLTRLLGPPVGNHMGDNGKRRAWAERRDLNRPIARYVLSTPITAELEAVAPDRCPTGDFIRSLTAAQLELFIDVSMMADGHTTNMGSRVISQAKRYRLDGFELACILSGRTPLRWQGVQRGFEQHGLTMSKRTTTHIPFDSAVKGKHPNTRVEWVSHTGRVWCPTTSNGTWMARRRDRMYFTGNSNAFAIDEETFKMFFEPTLDEICDAITTQYLWPSIMVMRGLDPINAPIPPDLTRYVCHYDASELLVHPNREQAVEHAFGTATAPNFAISGSAYRRYKAFSEADKPDAAEIAERLHQATILRARETLQGLVPTSADDSAADETPADGIDKGPAGTNGTTPTGTNGTGPAASGQASQNGRMLYLRLAAAGEAAIERAVVKVGNQLHNKVVAKRDPGLSASAGNADPRDVARTLGTVTVTRLIGDQFLIGEFDSTARLASMWAREAGRSDADSVGQRMADVLRRKCAERLFGPDAELTVAELEEVLG